MTTEQPYFVVQVDRCGKCPHEQIYCCGLVGGNRGVEILTENFDGITPTCPMWPQRVQEKKDE